MSEFNLKLCDWLANSKNGAYFETIKKSANVKREIAEMKLKTRCRGGGSRFFAIKQPEDNDCVINETGNTAYRYDLIALFEEHERNNQTKLNLSDFTRIVNKSMRKISSQIDSKAQF